MKFKSFIPLSALLLCSLLALSCSKNKQLEVRLTPDAKSQVTGNARLSKDEFSGSIYNGSDWDIKKIIFTIVALENNPEGKKDRVVKWERNYQLNLDIPPLSSRAFKIPITGGSYNFEFSIFDIMGIGEPRKPDIFDSLGEPPKK